MEAAAQIFTSGILIGVEYALAGVGMTLIFGVGRVLNLAHGVFFALGAYIAYETTRAGFPALAGAVPAAAAGFGLGLLVERLFVRPVRGHMLTAAVVLLGFAIVAEEGFTLLWGPAYHSVPLSLPPLMIHRVVASTEQVIDAAAVVVALGALGLFLRTRPGLAVRTTAADPEIATLSGINVAVVQMATFATTCAMAAAAGAFLSPLLVLSPTMGRTPLVLSLAMVIVGGPGSVWGTLIASLGLGLASTIVAYYRTAEWSYVLALVLIIGVVAWRPSTIWGERGPSARGQQVTIAGALLVWCLVPMGLAFAITDRFTESVLALGAIQALYAASWDLLGGVSGRVSLGHTLLFGGGAYLTAIFAGVMLLPPVTAVAAGAAGGALLGALQGILTGRLRPAFLALVTLSLAECGHELSGMLQLPGPAGLAFGGEGGIPTPLFPTDEFGAARLAAVVLTAGVIGFVWVARSSLGLAMRTAHADPQAAAVSGIDVGRVRLIAFILSGGGAGLAGSLLAGFAGRASPSMLSLETSFFAVAAASLGGVGTILGPATAAYLLTVALQWVDLPGPVRLTLYGAILVAAGLASPVSAVGFGSLFQRLRRRPGRG